METHLLLLLLRWRHLRLLGASTAINDSAEEQALILYLIQQELKFIPSRNRKVFYNALSLLEKRRRKERFLDTAEEIVVNREATSMRQSAEWGMRSFQSSFPRIKDRIIYEEGSERKSILKFLVYFFNFRANKVGINQIRNTYMQALQQTANVFYN